MHAEDAARRLFALRQTPVALARSLLADVVETDARLAWNGDAVALAAPHGTALLLEEATYVVVDLETTGPASRASPGSARSAQCAFAASRSRPSSRPSSIRGFRSAPERAQSPVSATSSFAERPGRPRLCGASSTFAGDAVLVAHNARFDLAFLDRETERLTGSRIGSPVVDTVRLARKLLAGRVAGFGLGQLAWFLDTTERPCHRALPDARATAELLLALIGLAQERGARTVADLSALAATKTRRLLDKRHLAYGAPSRPGVYRFLGRNDQILYIGRARDLRARLRSYFRSDRQRPAVEAAIAAAERIEWQVMGSELEAALEELRLIRELHPPGNSRVSRPERLVWLRQRGDSVVASTRPSPVGPLRSRRSAQLAARVLTPDELERPEAALPRLRRRLRDLSDARRFEDAGRLRDRIAALERVCRELKRLDRVRNLECCVLVPANEPGYIVAHFVAGGRVAAERTLPPGGGAALEIEAGLAASRRAGELDLDELLLVDSFLRRRRPSYASRRCGARRSCVPPSRATPEPAAGRRGGRRPPPRRPARAAALAARGSRCSR